MTGPVGFLKRFWKDQSGAASGDYVIILAIVIVGLASALVLLDGLEILAKNDF